MIQLTHLGRRTGWGHDDWLPVLAPSAVREAAHRSIPKVAEEWDLDRIVADFADAAERMQAGGMDGIELEAYGHLLDGFWSPLDQPPRRRVRRQPGEPDAVQPRRADRDPAASRQRLRGGDPDVVRRADPGRPGA